MISRLTTKDQGEILIEGQDISKVKSNDLLSKSPF